LAFTKIFDRIRYRYNDFLRVNVPHKIVIIESDDWGMERCVSDEGFKRLCEKYPESQRTRWFYDSLETRYDLDRLFGLLDNYADSFLKKPLITGNFVTHNIDYTSKDKVRFKNISANEQIPGDLYAKAIREKMLFPQLHGYSHFNNGDLDQYLSEPGGREDFLNGFFLAITTVKKNTTRFHGEFSDINANFKEEFSRANNEFKKMFGFESLSIIPGTYILDRRVQKHLEVNGLKIIQGANRLIDRNKRRRHLPYLRIKEGVFYNVRNARLDVHPDYEHFANADFLIKKMEWCFTTQQPCVIDFHRVNFASRFSRQWADHGLEALNKFLYYCGAKHPDIVFMNTCEFHAYLLKQCKLEI
jgi:hypothetical protein